MPIKRKQRYRSTFRSSAGDYIGDLKNIRIIATENMARINKDIKRAVRGLELLKTRGRFALESAEELQRRIALWEKEYKEYRKEIKE